MAWLSGWSYRKEISITGQSGAGTNYQVEFDIGDSAGGDFHLEGHCTSFPQDIAVTDDDGSTSLDFWIEDTAADPIKMWVEVADDLGSNQTIYVYYGKGEVPTASNGPDTFLSFFDGDSTGWTEVDPNSHITFQNNRLEFSGLHRGEDAYVYQSFTTSEWVCEEVYAITAAAAGSILISPATTDEIDDMAGTANAAFTQYYSGAYSRAGLRISSTAYNGGDQTIPTGTYYLRTTKSGNTITTNWYSDSARTNQVYTSTVTQAGLPSLSYIYILNTWNSGNSGYTISGWIDDFAVRKYNSPEPAFSSAGSEETPPVTGNPYWYYQMLKRRN